MDQELRHIFTRMKVGTCDTHSITQWLEIKNGEWFTEQDFTAVETWAQTDFPTDSFSALQFIKSATLPSVWR